jgi:hypothetical protein
MNRLKSYFLSEAAVFIVIIPSLFIFIHLKASNVSS